MFEGRTPEAERQWWADRLGDEEGRLAHPSLSPAMDEATAIRRFFAQGANRPPLPLLHLLDPAGSHCFTVTAAAATWRHGNPPSGEVRESSTCKSWATPPSPGNPHHRRRRYVGVLCRVAAAAAAAVTMAAFPTSRETVRAAARPGGGWLGAAGAGHSP